MYTFTTQENQEILFIPTNSISDTIYYISQDNKKNQRLIVDIPNDSNPVWNPNVWIVSKVERVNVRGRSRITIYQDLYNEHTDYIEKDENGKVIGMWADYYSTSVEPTDPSAPSLPTTTNYSKITAATSTIKIAGSYKTLTAKIYNESDTEITDNYTHTDFKWTCSVDDEDLTDTVTWLNTSTFNQIKLKFTDDRNYLGKTLDVKCVITTDTETITTIAQFELIV